MPSSVIGLDFGNTNSCVTYGLSDGEQHRVPVATGNPPYDTILASIVLDPERRFAEGRPRGAGRVRGASAGPLHAVVQAGPRQSTRP